MDFLLLDTVGTLSTNDYCFVADGPTGIVTAYDLKTGRSVFRKYPDGIGDVVVQLGEEFPGLAFSSFLPNADRLLAVDRKALAIIQAHETGETEVIPFRLLNHKGRLHSTDYVFLNPVGPIDALDMEQSEVQRKPDGKLVRVKTPVLAKAKVAKAPDLFRVKDLNAAYVFSQRLASALEDGGCTNFAFNRLKQV